MSMMEHYADGRVPFYGGGLGGGKIGANTQRPDIGSSEQAVVCTPEVSLYQTMVDGGKMNPALLTGQQVAGGFQCGFCGKTFEQKNTFQNHLRSHREGEDPYQCDICGKTFAVPARLTRHYRTHTGEKPYQCEYCNKSFSVKENLSVHRRIHTKERPYKCEVCDRAFEHSGKLHRHMRIHTGERPHRCQICQKTFIQSGQLVIHMRTHTGEKPYVCKVCNKGFTCSKQLKVHTRTHTGEKPYTCDICGKSFGYNHVLKLHQVAHYGEKVYKCTLCNGTFNSKKALENHIKTHSSSSSPMMSSMVDSPLSPDRDLELSPVQSLPMSSDKENRGDTSDSEISSQSSPLVIDTSIKSSPSPPTFKGTFNSATQQSLNHRYQQQQQQQQHHQQQQQQNQLPGYPMMLPPGIEVRTEPQKRTTFLYVTSKLPQQQQQQQQHQQHQNGRYGGHQTIAASKLYSTPSYPQQQQQQQQQQQSKYPPVNVVNVNSTLPPAAILERERLINQSASIRDKVLAFTEKFGYGLPSSSTNSPNNTSSSGGSLQAESNFLSSIRNRFDLPENLTTTSTTSNSNYTNGRYNSNNSNNKSYTPSGVLALALTRGSKAVVQGLTHNNTLSISPNCSPSSSTGYTSSPPDLSVDFSMAISRRSDSFSSTPRSTPPASSSSDEESGSVSGSGSRKRTNSSNEGSGPRKRSSLILEKYAQENPQSPASASSILSQRLRLSSVIQYAEKCT